MKTSIILMVMFLVGCATALTAEGGSVRVVEEGHDCQFISTLSAFDTFGANTGMESENALNELRNKAANIDANGVRILHMETTFQGTSVSAEALRCNF